MRTNHDSWKIGRLPKGCELCVRGEKTVLFMTGVCPRHCFYCPVSDKKIFKDVIYANERPIRSVRQAIEEIGLCSSKGVGITGGDPLTRMDRTTRFIKALKKRYGQSFHIHLYTPLELVSEQNLAELHKAGLDEIRFHPDLDDERLWPRIRLASAFSWDVGVEIPVLPGKERQTKKLISKLESYGVSFINLNELEIADSNANSILERGYRPKDRVSYGVKGSDKLGKTLLAYIEENTRLQAHYCTTTLKDRHQMGNRLKRRAKNISHEYDYVTKEGMLVRGVIYGQLSKVKRLLAAHKVPPELIKLERHRLLTNVKVVKQLAEEIKKAGGKPCIIEEYPTFDGFIVEQDEL